MAINKANTSTASIFSKTGNVLLRSDIFNSILGGDGKYTMLDLATRRTEHLDYNLKFGAGVDLAVDG